jgi:hypothetical protein
MKVFRQFALRIMLLALSAGMGSAQMVSAQSSGQNDSVDYVPHVKTIAGVLPLDTQYTLSVSAPTQLNKKGEEVIGAGINATLRVNVVAFPDGSSSDEAKALVSVDPTSMTFYALGETHQTIVRVAASGSTTPGDYMYTIQADGPEGIGWGNSAHTLTVTVSQPVLLDTTPPDVTITSPHNGDKFTFCTGGTIIPVTITAVDAESFVTAIGATAGGTAIIINPFTPAHSVDAEGQFIGAGVGYYDLEAWATSAGGTGNSPHVGISVNYAMSWLPPLSLGRTIAGEVVIKFAARDCQGKFVADTSVRVEVLEGGVLRFAAVYGDGTDAVRIQQVDEQYIANFKPAKGSHTYTVNIFFNNYLQASTTVTTK